MNDNIEDYILGQLLYYPQAQALLPRIKPNWFEGILHKHIVECSTTAAWLSLTSSKAKLDWLSLRRQLYVLRLI